MRDTKQTSTSAGHTVDPGEVEKFTAMAASWWDPDGDFRPLVESLQRQGIRVSVVSTIRSQPPMIADELRRQADNFIELDELREVVGRPPREPRAEAEDDAAPARSGAAVPTAD